LAHGPYPLVRLSARWGVCVVRLVALLRLAGGRGGVVRLALWGGGALLRLVGRWVCEGLFSLPSG